MDRAAKVSSHDIDRTYDQPQAEVHEVDVCGGKGDVALHDDASLEQTIEQIDQRDLSRRMAGELRAGEATAVTLFNAPPR